MTELPPNPPVETLTPGSSQSNSTHRTFSAYVEDPKDAEGLLAYALYKGDKRDFVCMYEEAHGRTPTEDELLAFIRGANLPARIDDYRRRAARMMESMTEEVLAGAVVQIQEEYDQRLVNELKTSRGFLKGVSENLVANFVAALITAVLLVSLSLALSPEDVLIKAGRAFNLNVSKAGDSAPEASKPAPSTR